MILLPQILNIIANENVFYKIYELELCLSLETRNNVSIFTFDLFSDKK